MNSISSYLFTSIFSATSVFTSISSSLYNVYKIIKLNCIAIIRPVFQTFEHLKGIISGELLAERNGWFNELLELIASREAAIILWYTDNIFLKKNTTKHRNCFYYSMDFL